MRLVASVSMGLLVCLAACGDDAGGSSSGEGGAGGGTGGAGNATSATSASGPSSGPSTGAEAATGTTAAAGSTTGAATTGAGGATSCAEPAERAGEATYYAADGTGNCSFDASNDMVAALNDPDYDVAAWCGACAAVDGPDGSVVVRIVDRCPECASGDLDLSPAAFAALAPLEQGRVPITWRIVPCEVEGPIAYRFKEGSNEFWSAIQIRNHRTAIAAVEALDASGAYVPLVRQDYNFFLEESGLGPGPYALRVTDVHGRVLADEAIPFAEAANVSGAAQFPACE